MRVTSALRYAASAVALGGVALFALNNLAPPAEGQANLIQNGEGGFVVSDIGYALSQDASETGACPNGMTLGGNRLRLLLQEANTPEGVIAARQAGLTPEQIAQAQAVNQGNAAATAGNQGGAQGQGQGQAQTPEAQAARRAAALRAQTGPSPCATPDQYQPDPNWRSVEARNIPAYGIDLDGQNSTRNGRAAPGTCAHDDFRGFNGERGIDNQFFRTVGCTPSYQSNGQSNGFATEMLTGAWGILIRLRGVDDLRNDPDVIVDISDNGDPIQLSPNREPLLNVTYAMNQDARFRAVTHGRIVNGVLTTDPVSVRFKKITNGVFFERNLEDARLRMTIAADGSLEGFMAGYTPVEDIYNFQFGMARGTNGAGEPRRGAGAGAAGVLGYTCNGAYYALWAAADGHRDPTTGRCSAISTQYRLRAIPAFVVDAPTQSANAELTPAGQRAAN